MTGSITRNDTLTKMINADGDTRITYAEVMEFVKNLNGNEANKQSEKKGLQNLIFSKDVTAYADAQKQLPENERLELKNQLTGLMAGQEHRGVAELEQELKYSYGLKDAESSARINMSPADKIAEKYPFLAQRADLDANGKISQKEVDMLVDRLNNGSDGQTDNMITPTELEHFAKAKFGPFKQSEANLSLHGELAGLLGVSNSTDVSAPENSDGVATSTITTEQAKKILSCALINCDD